MVDDGLGVGGVRGDDRGLTEKGGVRDQVDMLGAIGR